MKLCPCGSNKNYDACCGLYHLDKAIPATAEALMRSRYSAYVMAHIPYIIKTMQGKQLQNFNEKDAEQWAKSVHWLGLKVIDTQERYVEFIATYLENNVIKTIHEISEFNLNNDRWYYVDGKPIITPPIKVSRNDPCPCGSSKKFKQCHAKG